MVQNPGALKTPEESPIMETNFNENISSHGDASKIQRADTSFLVDTSSTRDQQSLRTSIDSRSPSLNEYEYSGRSSLSLGVNRLSAPSVSPLGQNSIFELIEKTNYKRRTTASGLLTLGSSPVTINVRGPTSRDIPMTQLSPLGNKRVHSSQFEPYLKTVGDSYNDFHAHKALTASTLDELMSELGEEEEKGVASSSDNEHSDSSLTTDDGISGQKRMRDSMTSEHQGKAANIAIPASEIPPLDEVPSVFFREDFRLDDPRIFNEVVHGGTILGDTVAFDTDGRQRTPIDAENLQHALSDSLDIVELHLIGEISKASGSFFGALGDLHEITSHSADLTNDLSDICTNLSSLKRDHAAHGIKTLNLARKCANVERLEQALLQIRTVMQHADLAEASYFNANYERALRQTAVAERLIAGKPEISTSQTPKSLWKYPLLDLRRLPALEPLRRLLSGLVSDTGRSLAKLFCDFLIEDLRSCYESTSSTYVLTRLLGVSDTAGATKSNEKYKEVTPEMKETLTKYIKSLAECNELPAAFRLYGSRFQSEMKAIVRSFLPGETEQDSSQSPASSSITGFSGTASLSGGGSSTVTGHSAHRGRPVSLGSRIRAMTPREFQEMLVSTLSQLSEALRRITVQQKLLLQTALEATDRSRNSAMDDRNPSVSASDLDISDALASAASTVQRRIAKIVNTRELQNSCVTLDYFLRLYWLCSAFVSEIEVVSGGRVTEPVLQDIVKLQRRRFLVQYHRATLQMLAGRTEKETWRDCKMSNETQGLLDQILMANKTKFETSAWARTIRQDLIRINSDGQAKSDSGPAKDLSSSSDNTDRSTLSIDGRAYIVPPLAGDFMVMVKHYEILRLQFPSLDDGSRMIELLKLLNLKTHQSVLGTQATRTAGLRNITSRHLAVTSQFLGFMAALVPHIATVFDDKGSGNAGSLAHHFERCQQNFADQQKEIFDKLVAIMLDRLESQSAEIRGIDWGKPLPHQGVHHYVESLVSKTLTIARILSRYLPSNEYENVLSQIFMGYQHYLCEIYGSIKLSDSVDKAVMMRDVDYFRAKLGDVAGYKDSGRIIWDAVNALPTVEDSKQVTLIDGSVEKNKTEKESSGGKTGISQTAEINVKETKRKNTDAEENRLKNKEKEKKHSETTKEVQDGDVDTGLSEQNSPKKPIKPRSSSEHGTIKIDSTKTHREERESSDEAKIRTENEEASRNDQKVINQVKKEAVKKEAVKKEAVKKEAVKKEAVKKEAVKKEAVKKEAVKKEAVKKEAVKKRNGNKKEEDSNEDSNPSHHKSETKEKPSGASNDGDLKQENNDKLKSIEEGGTKTSKQTIPERKV